MKIKKSQGVKFIEQVLKRSPGVKRENFTFDDLMSFPPENRSDFIRDYYYVLNDCDPYDDMVFLPRSQIEKAIFPIAVNEETHQQGVWAMKTYDRCVEDALTQAENEIIRGKGYIKSAAKILERLNDVKENEG